MAHTMEMNVLQWIVTFLSHLQRTKLITLAISSVVKWPYWKQQQAIGYISLHCFRYTKQEMLRENRNFPVWFSVKTSIGLSPHEIVFDIKPKEPINCNLSSTTVGNGNFKPTEHSEYNSLSKHTHSDHLDHNSFSDKPLQNNRNVNVTRVFWESKSSPLQ